jgi:dinuclear metal center YbgI/SA1388 family protein
MNRKKLTDHLNSTFKTHLYKDYGPNGLQIEGKSEIKKIGLAVSATRESIEKAVENNCDALIVHHGLFWKFHGPRAIKGSFAKRVLPLIKNEINLYGFHLPMDGHMTLGNASFIAKLIDAEISGGFGDYEGMPTGVKVKFKNGIKPSSLKNLIEKKLNHSVIHSSPGDEMIYSMGIVTGGANGGWRGCIKENLDAYLTGEISEHDYHEAKEEGIHFFAGGHHATERGGVLQLKDHLQEKFNIQCVFFDSDNPA